MPLRAGLPRKFVLTRHRGPACLSTRHRTCAAPRCCLHLVCWFVWCAGGAAYAQHAGMTCQAVWRLAARSAAKAAHICRSLTHRSAGGMR
jgi:hypothetical protein